MKLIKTELYSADDLSGTLKTNNYGKRENENCYYL